MNKTPEEIEEAKIKRRTYMREYKRKYYSKNRDKLSEYNKVYYLANNSDIPKDKLTQFTVMKSDFAKILALLEKIKEKNPDELKTFLNSYIEDI